MRLLLVQHLKAYRQISDPAVYGDTEWISVLFHGQSFMLHQVGWFIIYNVALIHFI
jgi:tRNA U38,U39,U40 pseudouridine synthase TruA